MTKKSKSKQKKNTKPTRKVQKTRQFESHYLALILIGFLLLEGILFSATNQTDWEQGVQMLDVSSAVMQTSSDVSWIFQPVSEAVAGVDQFYQLAATEAMSLLDLSEDGPIDQMALVTNSVFEFYEQASVELASMLDVSEMSSWPARVAGASIEVR
jgi:hypothetical protein